MRKKIFCFLTLCILGAQLFCLPAGGALVTNEGLSTNAAYSLGYGSIADIDSTYDVNNALLIGTANTSRGSNWERWLDGNQVVMNIYSYPAFTWDPESNSWCDYIFTSNFSGYYIATSQVWAHIASDG